MINRGGVDDIRLGAERKQRHIGNANTGLWHLDALRGDDLDCPLLLMIPKPESRQCLNPCVLIFAYVALPDFSIHVLAVRPVARGQVLFQRDLQHGCHTLEK